MKVIVQHNFRDKENDLVLRTAGEELEVPRKRAEYLANLQLVKIVKAQKGGDPKSPIEAEDSKPYFYARNGVKLPERRKT